MKERLRGGLGQRAAVADIARARAKARTALVEDDDEELVDPAMVAAAAQVFQKLEAMINSSRTYAADHPARQRFQQVLLETLQKFHAQYEDLVFNLEARGLNVEGEPVYVAKRSDTNMWFPLFTEGVRCIELAPGLRPDELTRLVELVQELRDPSREEDDEEDDAVTMLWEADFEHITFIAVDETIEGSGADNRRADAIQQMVERSTEKKLSGQETTGRARRASKIALGAADLHLLRAENLTTLDELPEAADAYNNVMRIDLDLSHRFGASCADESTIIERYVVALLHSLEILARTDDEAPVIEQLRELFIAVVADERYVRARLMVEQIIAVAQDERGAAHRWRSRVEREVVTEEVLADLLKNIDQLEADDANEVIWLCSRLSAWAAPTVLAAIAQTRDESVRDRLMAVTVSWAEATQAALADVIPGAIDDVALELVRLALRIGGPNVERSVRAGLRHQAPLVRANAMRAVLSFGDETVSDSAAAESVGDDDRTLRQLAAAYITRYGIKRARPALERLLESDKTDQFDPGELSQLYIALAAAGGNPQWFLDKLGQRNLLGLASGDANRIAAAAALGHLRHQPARPLLEKLTGGRMTRAEVKTATRQALHDLDQPPPPVLPRPRPKRMTPLDARIPGATETLQVRRKSSSTAGGSRPPSTGGTRPPPMARRPHSTSHPQIPRRPHPMSQAQVPRRPHPMSQPPPAEAQPAAAPRRAAHPTTPPPTTGRPGRSTIAPPADDMIQWKPAEAAPPAPTAPQQAAPERPRPAATPSRPPPQRWNEQEPRQTARPQRQTAGPQPRQTAQPQAPRQQPRQTARPQAQRPQPRQTARSQPASQAPQREQLVRRPPPTNREKRESEIDILLGSYLEKPASPAQPGDEVEELVAVIIEDDEDLGL